MSTDKPAEDEPVHLNNLNTFFGKEGRFQRRHEVRQGLAYIHKESASLAESINRIAQEAHMKQKLDAQMDQYKDMLQESIGGNTEMNHTKKIKRLKVSINTNLLVVYKKALEEGLSHAELVEF